MEQQAKRSLAPLKYSRCPSKNGNTLCKPPINFYGGLRSRLRIITFIFTRQGTKTTGEGRGTRPILCEPAFQADHSSLHLRPTQGRRSTPPAGKGAAPAEQETRPIHPNLGAQRPSHFEGLRGKSCKERLLLMEGREAPSWNLWMQSANM